VKLISSYNRALSNHPTINVLDLRSYHTAVWTRFLPLSYELQKVIHVDGAIGDVRAVYSDFCMQFLDGEFFFGVWMFFFLWQRFWVRLERGGGDFWLESKERRGNP
jgi:hypothetical protein